MSGLVQSRDVVLFDRRGTGRSEPATDCPEVHGAIAQAIATANDPTEEATAMRDAWSTCLERLADEGVALGSFTPEDVGHDAAAVRAALGIEGWVVIGFGDHVESARTLAGADPNGVRALVLDSPGSAGDAPALAASGPESVDAAVEAWCAGDDRCVREHPDPAAALRSVVEARDDAPLGASVTIGGEELPLQITGADLVAALHASIQAPRVGAASVIDFSLRPNNAVTSYVVGEYVRLLLATSTGADAAFACTAAPSSSAAPSPSAPQHSTLATFDRQASCTGIGDDPSAAPVEVGVPSMPVLLIVGAHDPTVAPLSDLEAAYPRSRVVVVDAFGSLMWERAACVPRIVMQFLDDPAADLADRCAAGEDAARFASSVPIELPVPGEPESANTGDPHVIRVGDTWYMYPSERKPPGDLDVWISDDLRTWRYGGEVWTRTPGSWNAEGGAWAPGVLHTDNGFFLYYTANEKVGVARSDSPTGPFEEVLDRPLVGAGNGGVGDGVFNAPPGAPVWQQRFVDGDENAIDAFPFQAADGSITLYVSAGGAGGSRIVAIPMRDETTVDSDRGPVTVIDVDARALTSWEAGIREGPWVIEHDGVLHLQYSAADSGGLDYGIADAVGTNPLGPFVRRVENPIVHAHPDQSIFAPGHHSITTDGDGNLIAFYHARLSAEPGVRRIRSTPVTFDDAGNVLFGAP